MRHLVFVIWLIGWPIGKDFGQWVDWKTDFLNRRGIDDRTEKSAAGKSVV